jgi:hypothetical protein
MRLHITLFLTTLLASLQFSAYAHRLNKRGEQRSQKPAQAIQSRQHHVKKELIDLCLSTNALAVLGLGSIANPFLAGLDLCLCLKVNRSSSFSAKESILRFAAQDLNVFLESHVGVLLSNLLGGKSNLLAKLHLLVRDNMY